MFEQFRHAFASKGITGILLYWNPLVPNGRGFIYKCRFLKHYHRFVNEKRPVLLDEKLITVYDKIYSDDDMVSKCADKYLVREYVKRKMGGGVKLFSMICWAFIIIHQKSYGMSFLINLY